MKCTKCDKKGIHENQGQVYCKDHFIKYFENKIFKTIKKYNMFDKDDKVCIATSGGKDSVALLYVASKYCKQHGIDFFALCIDEGISGYRDNKVRDLKKFCKDNKIELKVVSFKKSFGLSLDDLRKKAYKKLNKKPCTVCGVFRRTLLNRVSREFKATKIATGHNLDDEAQTYLMNLFFGNMQHNAGLGPVTGLSEDKKFVQRVKPLYLITEKETRLYCLVKNINIEFIECPYIKLSFRAIVRDNLNRMEQNIPGLKYGIINSFLEVLPTLKNFYRDKKSMSYCQVCGDACSGKICNACKLEDELCKK